MAPHQAALPPIIVIVDVHGLEVEQEPVRVMEHGVAMPQPVNVCDTKFKYSIFAIILNYYSGIPIIIIEKVFFNIIAGLLQ